MNARFQKNHIEGVCETSKVVKISLHFGYLGTCLFVWGKRRGGWDCMLLAFSIVFTILVQDHEYGIGIDAS